MRNPRFVFSILAVFLVLIVLWLHQSATKGQFEGVSENHSLHDLESSSGEPPIPSTGAAENYEEAPNFDVKSASEAEFFLSRLAKSGSLVSIARKCGKDIFSLRDRMDFYLDQKYRPSPNIEMKESQLAAIARLEQLCRDWLNVVEVDPTLADSVTEEISIDEMTSVFTTAEDWSASDQEFALKVLRNGGPMQAAEAVAVMISHDQTVQLALAELLGTTDLHYIRNTSSDVAKLVGCRLEGNCGPDGLSALGSCAYSGRFCLGIERGLQDSRSLGQYEDLYTMAAALVAYANGSSDGFQKLVGEEQ